MREFFKAFKVLLLITFVVCIVGSVHAQVSGTYTINKNLPFAGRNFPTFDAAIKSLSNGVNGPVEFVVSSVNDEYNEQITLNKVKGSSSVNSITIKGNGNKLSFASASSNDRAVIKLDSADHFIIDSLIIDATGGTYGFGVQLMNSADSNTIKNCVIYVDSSTTSTNFAGIVIAPSASNAIGSTGVNSSNDNIIENNRIEGGYYGMTMCGTTGDPVRNTFRGNIVRNAYYYGIYLTQTIGAVIEHNEITNPTRTNASTFYAVYLTTGASSSKINGNVIRNLYGGNPASTGSQYMFYATAASPGNVPSVYSNNVVYNINGAGQIYVFYNSGASNSHYLHNTVILDNVNNASANAARPFYQAATAEGLHVMNNIFKLTRNGSATNHAIYIGATTTNFVSNNNNIILGTGSSVGYYNFTNYPTYDAWRLATNQDAASHSLEPYFKDVANGNFQPTSPEFDNLGTATSVKTDFLNISRSNTRPDIGAYEFTPAACIVPSITGNIVNSVIGPACIGAEFELKVDGGEAALGLTFQWQKSINGGAWQDISGATTRVVKVTQDVTTKYRIAYFCSGLATYSAEIEMVSPEPGGFRGTYTINKALPTGGTNFRSFTEAYRAMQCGISAPVVFNVAPNSGPYQEQLIMNEIPGTSVLNTVTFNGNGNTIEFTATNTNERAVIKLNGADHIIFDSLIVRALGKASGEYGFGVQFMNNADSNVFKNSKVYIDFAGLSTSFAGIVINASATGATTTGASGTGNIIENNLVEGGYFGIIVVGASNKLIDVTIRNNKVKDFYYYGLYTLYHDGSVIEYNDIYRPERTNVTMYYGFNMGAFTVNTKVNGNKFHDPFGANPASTLPIYGINTMNCDATAEKPNIFSNNLFYDLNGAGTIYVIYNSSSDFAKYYHNTISIDNPVATTGSATAFFQTTLATGIEFRNNIVSINKAGTSTNFAIYLGTATTSYAASGNVYHLGNSLFGYSGVRIPTFAEWKTQTVYDEGSVEMNPRFLSVLNANYQPNNPDIKGLGRFVNIPQDINGKRRSTTAPDPGAYEFTVVNCTEPPVPGVLASTMNPVCMDDAFTLSIAGGEIGAGLKLQWQSSDDGGITWTNMLNDTLGVVKLSQKVTKSYRVEYKCGTSTTYSNPLVVNTPEGLRGIFTINKAEPTGGTNFNSFTAANDALKCGISGHVVFNVTPDSGPYNEQLLMGEIKGTSADATITFNGNGNTLSFLSTSTNERAVIRLNNTDYITFDSLNIVALASGNSETEYGYGVFITNNADKVTIKNSKISVTETSFSTNFSGIVISGAANNAVATTDISVDSLTLTNNTISGGYYSLAFSGGADVANMHAIIKGNTFKEFYSYGIYLRGSFNALVDSNLITRPTRTSLSTFYGIYTTALNTKANITRNVITNPFGGNKTYTGLFYGIYFLSTNALVQLENVVSNNLIYDVNNAGSVFGIYNGSSNNVWYYHNTINLDGSSSVTTATTRAFYQTGAASGIEFRNNNVTISRTGTDTRHMVYLNTPNTDIVTNNNNYYFNNNDAKNFVGYLGSNDFATLLNWQTTLNDTNSVANDPLYENIANGNFKPTNASVNDLGAALTSPIAIDILGETRKVLTPDMGAYEFEPDLCKVPPVAGISVASESPICENATVYLSLSEHSTGKGQTYTWQASTDSLGSYANISSPLTNSTFSVNASSTLYYRAEVTCGSSTTYSIPIAVKVIPGLAGGTYTINKEGLGDFKNFNEAVTAMSCGITSSVIFNVAPGTGPYEEQVIIDSIRGTSASSTVTFNGNGNTLKFSSTNTDERAVITLRRADFVTFDSLIIDAAGNGAYGWGVFLTNDADSNTIKNSTINIPQNSITANYAGIVIAASSSDPSSVGDAFSDGNVFDNNTIKGGYYGIAAMGGNNAFNANNIFRNNIIQDFYEYGIYISRSQNNTIENNRINRSTRTSVAAFYGIYTTGNSYGLKVSKNRIYDPFAANLPSTAAAHGIYIDANDASDLEPTIVSNNAIYNFNGGGTLYGVYNNSSDNVKLYHNTVAFNDAAFAGSSSSYGFYQTSTAYALEFTNNILHNTRGGAGSKFGMYLATANTEFISNHNNVYVNGAAGNNNFGYIAANRPTLTAWQSFTTQDANSTVLNPLFVNTVTGDLAPSEILLDNTGTSVGITTDINGVTRSLNTPDVGAFEITIQLCTEPAVAGSAIVNTTAGLCLGQKIVLDLNGNSTGGAQTYVWQKSIAANGPWIDISDSLYSPKFEYELNDVSTYFRAVVSCGTTRANSTSVQIVLNPLMIAGDYTIDPALPTAGRNFASFKEAVAALQCGIEGPVRFLAVPGEYNEQVLISKVPGTSDKAGVTFLSNNNNKASVTLTAASTVVDNYVLKFNGAQHITFRDITIKATDVNYGNAVVYETNASYDTILNCSVIVPVNTSTANNVIGVFGSSLTGSYNLIKGNEFQNGSKGVFLSGTSGFSKQFTIDSNAFAGTYQYDIYVANIDNVNITKNKINRKGLQSTSAYGIYSGNANGVYNINNNTIIINNIGTTTYGIYANANQSSVDSLSSISNNTVTATSDNNGTIYGLYFNASTYANVKNNAVAINTSSTVSYGVYATGSVGGLNFYNNSVQNASPSTSNTSAAAYFSKTTAANGVLNIRNNIFSHSGGNRAYQVVNQNFIYSDYNMFYTSGATLIQLGASGGNLGTLKQWIDAAEWDAHSIVYKPAFTSVSDLAPNVAAPEVWAIHGRGVQLDGNGLDINGNIRHTKLADGVPSLGAYEFTPASVPVALTATPANPVANAAQVFMLGTDTVTKVTWGADVPATVVARRYSGVKPSDLNPAQQFMYFYTDFDFTGTAPKGQIVEQFYLPSWLGTVPEERALKLGATNTPSTWAVSANSSVSVIRSVVTDTLDYLDKFTGLTNGVYVTPPIVLSALDSSNRGTQFWVGYGHHQYFEGANNQNMVVYMGAGAQAANVTVRVNGTTWEKQYYVPANSAISSDELPKIGLSDSRLLKEGLSEKGISITSDVPITATAHIYANTTSGATMLMPVGTYGYEYYALTSKQQYSTDTYSWFYVVAAYDSTVVEITPSKPTLNGRTPGVPFTVRLNKGEVYQVLGSLESGSMGFDLTGSKIKSIGNDAGKCYPIAVFSGSSRTNIGCDMNETLEASGDNIIQQNFAYSVWGRRYLTAPTSQQHTPNQFNPGVFRVMVKNPTAVVRRNGQVLTDLVDNLYYQFESKTADLIESDKPMMVAQFMPSANTCDYVGYGDPNMIYLSPIEQGIKEVALYRNTESAITVQYLTLIIPNGGLPSLTIDGSNTFDHVYDHPALAGYKVVIKRWTATKGQTVVKSDSAFTATTYGLGNVESYGFNAGTMVKNLNVLPSITNVFNPAIGTSNPYTCTETPFQFKFLSTLEPSSIKWHLEGVDGLDPNQDVFEQNPVSSGTVIRNGSSYFEYTLNGNYTINKPGDYKIRIAVTHPEIDECNMTWEALLDVKVYDKPKVDFTFNNICLGAETQLLGTAETVNNTPINKWTWSIENNTDTLRTQSSAYIFGDIGTYNVKLSIVSNEGCIADTTKAITVSTGPKVEVVAASLVGCPGGEVTFNVKDPVSGVSYKWFTSATGGTSVHTGNRYTVTGISGATSYWIESDMNGCLSKDRTQVQITMGVGPVVELVQTAVVGCINNSVTFQVKDPVAGIVYSWYNTATGGTALGTGTIFTVNNLPGAGSYFVSGNNGGCISAIRSEVKVTIGVGPVVTLVNNSLLGCLGGTVTFQVQNPVAGVAYNWFTTVVGGTPVHTGTSYTISSIPGSVSYFVESNNGGCISALRAEGKIELLPLLALPVATVDSAGVNMLRFKWNAVPSATGYEVSTNNGVSWTVPSSGSTGLTHEITGLTVGTLVELQIRALGGCEPSVSLVVSGRTLTDRVYVPNSFSPNGDGINDVLRVKANGLRQIRFVVFNQWGQKISESTDQNRAWDGTHKGKQQPVGVYFYTFEATLADGSVIQRKGSVNLIR